MSAESLEFKFEIDPDEDLLKQLKEFEAHSSEYLIQGFSQGINVRELVLTRSNHIDTLLCKLWQHLKITNQFSLIAVGGYGRGELHPFSDIDLLILAGDSPNPEQTTNLSHLITLLWDTGLVIGHATRTVKQCIKLAKQDITVVTNLMESRLLCGCEEQFSQMKILTAPDKMWDAKKFFDAKTKEQKERYKKFDGSSYDLEPNVKSSPGGLRDIQLIAWVAQRRYYPKSLFQLITQNVITKKEYYTLVKCQLFIWKVRFALHLISRKAEDRLLFDYQRDTAELMGFKDSKNLLAVEKMMKRYYRSVLIIRNIGDILLQSIEEDLPGSWFTKVSVKIDDDFQIINHRIDAIDTNIFNRQPSNLLKIFHLVAKNENIRGITATTVRAMRAARNKITPKFRKKPENKQLFLQFWHIKHTTSRAMFLMKRSGILSDFLPAFQKISGQMQYDMFHSYTVDEHTLFLLKNLTEFTEDDAKKHYPLCYEIMKKLDKPELIYLAGLFHDIGKGRGGDHSEIGAQEVLNFCKDHKMNDDDTETISWLVANHLIMSLTAQKRDTSDPLVIKNFADMVGTPQRLELLYILTVADIRATSRSLWNSWKDSLLKELALATLAYLKNEQNRKFDSWKKTKENALKILTEESYSSEKIEYYWQYLDVSYFIKIPAETIAWHSKSILDQIDTNPNPSEIVVAIRKRRDGAGSEIFVFSKDVDDLFATLTATLAQHGLNVQGASIYTDANGYCYDSFFTLDNTGKPIITDAEQKRLETAIKRNIKAIDSSDIAIQKRMPRQFKHFDVNTEIVFSKDEYSHYTRLDIIARDQPGLLALLAQAFKQCDVRLHDARITTLGEKVEDTFIISHKNNDVIDDPQDQDDIKQAIKRQLASKI